jgi:cephalosporin hydroxylase
MILTIDTETKTITRGTSAGAETVALYSPRAFEWISREWVRVGWGLKYSYQFTWLGRPIIQMPEDMVRIQEVIYQVQPDVIIETGVAHGGSLVFYASLCKLLGKGRVIGIDIEIRPHNRSALEKHEFFNLITLIEGSSTSPSIVEQVRAFVRPEDKVLVMLDSCHTKEHVRNEMEVYGPLVTPGSYMVAADGIMQDLSDVPGGKPDWNWNNPSTAAVEFAAEHPEFKLESPIKPFSESHLETEITYWPSAWLRREAL